MAHIWEQKNTYRLLAWEDVDWVNVAQDRTSGRLLCTWQRELCSIKCGDLLSKQETVSVSTRTLVLDAIYARVSECSFVPDDNAVWMCTVLFTFPSAARSTSGGVRTLPRFICSTSDVWVWDHSVFIPTSLAHHCRSRVKVLIQKRPLTLWAWNVNRSI